jgi:hypothetical protein
MTQVYGTLRVTPSDEAVLGVVIDAPPVNLIGPELVRDLVGLLGALESGQQTRVVVLESADPDYFVAPHASNDDPASRFRTIDGTRIRYAGSGGPGPANAPRVPAPTERSRSLP